MVSRDELVERQPAIRHVTQQLDALLSELLRTLDLVRGLLPLWNRDDQVVGAVRVFRA